MTELIESGEHSWEEWVNRLAEMTEAEQLSELLTKTKSQHQEIQLLLSDKSELMQQMQKLESQLQEQAEKVEKLNNSDEELKKAQELQAELQKKAEKIAQRAEELNIKEEVLNQKESAFEEIEEKESAEKSDEIPEEIKNGNQYLIPGLVILIVVTVTVILKKQFLIAFKAFDRMLAHFSVNLTASISERVLRVCLKYSMYYGMYIGCGLLFVTLAKIAKKSLKRKLLIK